MNDRKEAIAALHRKLGNAPSFLVVRGNVFVTMAGQTSILPKEGRSWKNHGKFIPLYVEDNFALIDHYLTRGERMPLFIPPYRRMNASNGQFVFMTVNYDSFVFAFDNHTLVTRHNRKEFNHYFVWDRLVGAWSTTKGNKVFVIPPLKPEDPWKVEVYATRKVHDLTGEDVEKRAFCIAEGFSRQQL